MSNNEGKDGWRDTFRVAKRLFFLSIGISNSWGRRVRPDLTALAAGQGWQIDNCAPAIVDHEGRYALKLSAQPGDGRAWLLDHIFTTGKIDFRIAASEQQVGLILDPLSIDAQDQFGFRFTFTPSSGPTGSAIDLLVWMDSGGQRQEAHHYFPLKMRDEWIPIRIIVSREIMAILVDQNHVPSLKIAHGHSAQRRARLGIWRGSGSPSLLADLRLIQTDEWNIE